MKRIIGIILLVCLLLAPGHAFASEDAAPMLLQKFKLIPKHVAYQDLTMDGTWHKDQYVYRDDEDGESPGPTIVQYQFELEEPAYISIEMKSYNYGTWLTLYDLNESGTYNFLSGGSHFVKKTATHKISAYLTPGIYAIDVEGLNQEIYRKGFAYQVRYAIRAKLTPLTGITHPESANQTPSTAYDYTLGESVKDVLGIGGNGQRHYRFTLPEDAKIRFAYKQYKKQFNCLILRADDSWNVLSEYSSYSLVKKKTLSKAKTYKKDVNLPKGNYYLVVSNVVNAYDYYYEEYRLTPSISRNGRYDFTLTNLGNSSQKLTLPKTTYVTRGFTKSARSVSAMSPAYFNLPETISYSLSSPTSSIASIDESGIITGKKLGKIKLTALNPNNPAMCATSYVQVRDNGYYSKYPYYIPYSAAAEDHGDWSAYNTFFSARKMYCKGDFVYVDMYVLNRNGYTLKALSSIHVWLYDYDRNVRLSEIPWVRQELKKTIKNKKYAILTAVFPRSLVENIDLWNSNIDVQVTFDEGTYASNQNKSFMSKKSIPITKKIIRIPDTTATEQLND
ncbi:hypothetical protein LJC33_06065 [Eubacteriales bacterium OttesenSCG-928-N13]|nr:hypothetical protein [Eubacteriales bacterium OttesenSCG-928-N13]